MTNNKIKLFTISAVLASNCLMLSGCESKISSLEELAKSVCTVYVKQSSRLCNGTGFLIEGDYIVTADHLFLHYSEIKQIDVSFLGLPDKYSAEIVNYDSLNDIAILKCNETKKLKKIHISNQKYDVGDTCYTIGYQNSITIATSKGIISNPNCYIDTAYYIESNIYTYSGCSGSPLLNESLECIGVQTKSFSTREGFAPEFGYAVKAETIRNLLNHL